MPIFLMLGNIVAPIIAQMGLRLLTERVVRRVAVVTLRSFEDRVSNPRFKEAIDIIADALEVPEAISKKP